MNRRRVRKAQCVGEFLMRYLFRFLRNQTLLVTRGEQLTLFKSGLNMKKWFAPVTFVQKKDTQEKLATASEYSQLPL